MMKSGLFCMLLFINFMEEQQTQKFIEFCELKEENERLNRCFEHFSTLQEKVKQTQNKQIEDRYQFFLRKFSKYVQEHQKYLTAANNLDSKAEQSVQVQEEVKSIMFIKMVSEDTEKKLTKLIKNVEKAKQDKFAYKEKVNMLKEKLISQKREYFKLKRREEELKRQKLDKEILAKSQENNHRMMKIRLTKKDLQIQKQKIQKLQLQNLLVKNGSQAHHKLRKELQLIDEMKKSIMKQAGLSQSDYFKTCQKFHSNQKENNRKIRQRQINIACKKSKPQPKDERDSQLYANYSIMKIFEDSSQDMETFKTLSADKVLEMVIQQGKIGQLLNLIQKQKEPLVKIHEQYKFAKIL